MRSWFAAAFLLVASVQTFAQDAEALERFERTLENIRTKQFESAVGLKLSEYSRVLYGAYVTLSGLATDDETGSTKVLRQADAKLWTQVQAKGHMFYGRLRLRYRDFNTGDSFTGSGDELVAPIGDRYWYRFDWAADQQAEGNAKPDWNWWVQTGKQYMQWVSGMVLSESLYAVRAGVDTGQFYFEAFWGTTPRTGPIDFDASRPGYTSDVARDFWGASLEYRGFADHRPYVYVISQEDENDQVLPGGLRFGYDSFYVAIGSAGQIRTGSWIYRAEIIFESGTSTSDLLGAFPQSLDDVSAWAARIMIAWMPPQLRRWRMRVEFEVLLGSGDDDRLSANQTAGGNVAGTDDNSFNAFGYINTGLALAPELANLISVRIGVSLLPYDSPLFKNLRFGFDTFLIAKMDSNAPLSVTTIPGGDSFVGVEFDFILDWKISSDASVDLRYGIFMPGDAIVESSARHFFYLGFSYGF